MRALLSATLLVASLSPSLSAQSIIAQTQGLTNPQHVIDFGANLYPNFTPITNQFAGITVTHARYFTTGTVVNLVGGFLTNDFSGAPDTLSIRFANPIQDLAFVYHQISTVRPSVFRAVLAGTTVHSFSNLSNQSQTNNWFGFTGIVFDELQLDFVADFNVDTLQFNDAGAACTTRNGSGVNPIDYRCATRPILGTTWQSVVAMPPNAVAAFLVFGPGGGNPGLPSPFGEILLNLSPAPIALSGGPNFNVNIPNGPQWNGFTIATQAARIDLVGPQQNVVLLNAIDLRLGL